jgi:hypothetical protein
VQQAVARANRKNAEQDLAADLILDAGDHLDATPALERR